MEFICLFSLYRVMEGGVHKRDLKKLAKKAVKHYKRNQQPEWLKKYYGRVAHHLTVDKEVDDLVKAFSATSLGPPTPRVARVVAAENKVAEGAIRKPSGRTRKPKGESAEASTTAQRERPTRARKQPERLILAPVEAKTRRGRRPAAAAAATAASMEEAHDTATSSVRTAQKQGQNKSKSGKIPDFEYPIIHVRETSAMIQGIFDRNVEVSQQNANRLRDTLLRAIAEIKHQRQEATNELSIISKTTLSNPTAISKEMLNRQIELAKMVSSFTNQEVYATDRLSKIDYIVNKAAESRQAYFAKMAAMNTAAVSGGGAKKKK